MRYFGVFLALLLFSNSTKAQPGGGGGLYFHSFHNSSLEPIDSLKTPQLKIRLFLMDGPELHHEVFLLHPSYNHFLAFRASNKAISLPPPGSLSGDLSSIQKPILRLLIFYERDTMLLDIEGVMEENAGGYVDFMDSLVIQQGYFQYNRDWKFTRDHLFISDEERASMNGISPHIRDKLQHHGLLKYQWEVDLGFLDPKNLPATYFFERAEHYLQIKDGNHALDDILEYIERSKGDISVPASIVLSNAYNILGQYQKAIAAISHGLEIWPKGENFDWIEETDGLSSRAALYTKTGQLNKALDDYDKMVHLNPYNTHINIRRAQFKITHLKDLQGAIDDLSLEIESIPAKHLSSGAGPRNYKWTYFALGLAQYQHHDLEAATHSWQKALELGYSYGGSSNAIDHFDSIIAQHPTSASLYFCRGLAHVQMGPYQGWGDVSQNSFSRALDDFEKAEKLGFTNYQINQNRALALNNLKRHEEALEEINRAIAKNKNSHACYSIRADINRRLGHDNTEDWNRYNELIKEWVFEK